MIAASNVTLQQITDRHRQYSYKLAEIHLEGRGLFSVELRGHAGAIQAALASDGFPEGFRMPA